MGFLSSIPWIEKVLADLESAEGLGDLQALAERIRAEYSVGHVVYHWVNSAGQQYGCGTYDPAWVERYLDRNYLRIDPVIQGCYQRFHPVDWKRLDWSGKAARDFLRDAVAFGLGNQGYSIPIRGPNGQFALFTVNHDCDDDVWAAFTEENRRDLILLAHYFNHQALELEPGRTPPEATPLSPREIDALTLLAMGYSRAQVADTLTISEHTLRVYIESARHKLGALNTTHAVARALQRGVIVV